MKKIKNKKSPTKKKTSSSKKKKRVNSAKVLPFPGVSPKQFYDDLEFPDKDPLSQAQDLIYDAWEAPTRKKGISLAKKALSICADCSDAYNFLAEEEAKTLEEALELFQKGVEAGERTLGEDYFKENEGYFWGLIETRPYMRAKDGLARKLFAIGEKAKAVDHFQDMLRLNPNDNQGVRYTLLPCLINLERHAEAQNLLEIYPDDLSAFWSYSRALLAFKTTGESPEADAALRLALDSNKHVPDFLLARVKFPVELPHYYGSGDENEAVFYILESDFAWKETPGALAWLAIKTGV